jgi:2-polyprenyl-3-methyl-5-hydroxy-6-metoxy-1,4-benzoquinol methylase
MEVNYCRICRSKLNKIINFGKIALVNDFKKNGKNKKFKISLSFCLNCKHVQIPNLVNPKKLFENYIWETGISKTNNDIILDLIDKLKKFGLSKKSSVLDIASNDGILLKLFKLKIGCFTLGVDPAKNLAKKANQKGLKTLAKFFNYQFSKILKEKFGNFDFITARNVVAHVTNPNEIFSGVNNLLSTNGVFVVEVPHLLNIIKENQYDNIYHEHIGFHSLKSLVDLANKNGLTAFKVQKIDSQGGSLRCFFKKRGCYKLKTDKSIQLTLAYEKRNKLFDKNSLKKYKLKINNHRKNFLEFLKKLKKNKKKISIYGASGRGQSLLQFSNIGNKIIDTAYDKSRMKQQRKTPGTYIPVSDPKKINRKNIDYLLILSWNLQKEIIKQESVFRKNGGRFIVPFPTPKIIK